MNPKLPKFEAGAKSVSAKELNSLVEFARATYRRLAAMETKFDATDGDGYQRMTVLIVKQPVETDATLRVHRVAYDRSLPKGCEQAECFIRYVGEAFDAYPDYGFGVMDYDGYQLTASRLPVRDDKFLKAEREHGTWRLERPVTSGAAGVVTFGRLTHIGSGALSGRIVFVDVADGQTYSAAPQPGTATEWYRPLVARTVTCPIVVNNVGDLVVLFYAPLRYSIPDPGAIYPSGGCSV